MRITDHILKEFKDCQSPPNDDWLSSYERLCGAATSLLAAHPFYTEHTQQIAQRYDDIRDKLPNLVEDAYRAGTGLRIEFSFQDLKWWSSGFFFNSALSRIANSLEKTLALKCRDPKHKQKDRHSIRDCAKSLQGTGDATITRLADMPSPSDLELEWRRQAQVVSSGLVAQDNAEVAFAKISADPGCAAAALAFVWWDTNIQKHDTDFAERRHQYVGCLKREEDPRVQYSLGVVAYREASSLYRTSAK